MVDKNRYNFNKNSLSNKWYLHKFIFLLMLKFKKKKKKKEKKRKEKK